MLSGQRLALSRCLPWKEVHGKYGESNGMAEYSVPGFRGKWKLQGLIPPSTQPPFTPQSLICPTPP